MKDIERRIALLDIKDELAKTLDAHSAAAAYPISQA